MIVAQDEWICRVVVPLALAEETNVQRVKLSLSSNLVHLIV